MLENIPADVVLLASVTTTVVQSIKKSLSGEINLFVKSWIIPLTVSTALAFLFDTKAGIIDFSSASSVADTLIKGILSGTVASGGYSLVNSFTQKKDADI